MRNRGLFFGVLFCILIFRPVLATTIYDVQYTTSTPTADPDTCYPSPLWNSSVTLTGIVTGVEQEGSYVGTYWIAEWPGGPWHGIYVFDRYLVINPVAGDSVTVTGQVNEYYGWTEIGTVSSGTIHSHGHYLPDTTVISTRDIAADDSCFLGGEQFESVLCILHGVTVTDTSTAPGRWKVADTSGVECLIDNYSFSYVPRLGQNIESICGVVRYSYGQFRLSPRTAADIVIGYPFIIGACSDWTNRVEVMFSEDVDEASSQTAANYTIPGLSVTSAVRDTDDHALVHLGTSSQTTLAPYTLTVINVQDLQGNPIPPGSPEDFSFLGGVATIDSIQTPVSSENDSSRYAGNVATISGIVTADSTAFPDYYLEMAQGGPWSGIRVHDSAHEPLAGDSVLVAGTVAEYYNLTELNGVFFYRNYAFGHALPAPIVVSSGAISPDTSTPEPYEDVLVRVEHAAVVDTMDQYGQWRINDGSGACMVDDWAGYSFVPALGDTVSVTGVLDFSYSEFKIQPRGDADITRVGIDESDPGQPSAPSISLFPSFPNPFSGETWISFVLPEPKRITLEIYNALGQRVKTLLQEQASRGKVMVAWRGDGDEGRHVSSGVYFYRLSTERGVVGCQRVVFLE